MSTFSPSHKSSRIHFRVLSGQFKLGAQLGRARFHRSRLFTFLTAIGLVTGIAGVMFMSSGSNPLSALNGITTNILPAVAWDDASGQGQGWMPYAGDSGSNVPVTPETSNTVNAGDSHSVPPAHH